MKLITIKSAQIDKLQLTWLHFSGGDGDLKLLMGTVFKII